MKRTGNPNIGTAPCFSCLGLQSSFPLSKSSGQAVKQRPREWPQTWLRSREDAEEGICVLQAHASTPVAPTAAFPPSVGL